jgi:RNA polymerase sigma-70 factor, ECF subfamily
VEPDIILNVTQLHDEYADFVWRSLQRLGVTPISLEDALQDVFVVVHRKLNSYDGTCKLSTWLFGICLRVASAYRRRAYLRHEVTSLGTEAKDETHGQRIACSAVRVLRCGSPDPRRTRCVSS